MTLSKEDGQLYYKLWLPLLDYVNVKYRINRKLKLDWRILVTSVVSKPVLLFSGKQKRGRRKGYNKGNKCSKK